MHERAEESAAEVLARLERYVEGLRAQPEIDPRAHEGTPLRHRRFVSEVAPALIAVAICSFVILLSVWFDAAVGVFISAALLLVGVVGLVRRVPLARAYTFGLVVAALLIRLS